MICLNTFLQGTTKLPRFVYFQYSVYNSKLLQQSVASRPLEVLLNALTFCLWDVLNPGGFDSKLSPHLTTVGEGNGFRQVTNPGLHHLAQQSPRVSRGPKEEPLEKPLSRSACVTAESVTYSLLQHSQPLVQLDLSVDSPIRCSTTWKILFLWHTTTCATREFVSSIHEYPCFTRFPPTWS